MLTSNDSVGDDREEAVFLETLHRVVDKPPATLEPVLCQLNNINIGVWWISRHVDHPLRHYGLLPTDCDDCFVLITAVDPTCDSPRLTTKTNIRMELKQSNYLEPPGSVSTVVSDASMFLPLDCDDARWLLSTIVLRRSDIPPVFCYCSQQTSHSSYVSGDIPHSVYLGLVQNQLAVNAGFDIIQISDYGSTAGDTRNPTNSLQSYLQSRPHDKMACHSRYEILSKPAFSHGDQSKASSIGLNVSWTPSSQHISALSLPEAPTRAVIVNNAFLFFLLAAMFLNLALLLISVVCFLCVFQIRWS